jgi:hypothetical protein
VIGSVQEVHDATAVCRPLITLAVGIPAFLLSRLIWSPASSNPTPSDAQLPFFIVLSLVEALLFGLGVAFLAYGLPVVRRAARRAAVNAWPVCLPVAWQLVSWWPHDNFHMATGMDLHALLLIEYGFHLTLIVSTLVVARFFLATLHGAAVVQTPARTPATRTGSLGMGHEH